MKLRIYTLLAAMVFSFMASANPFKAGDCIQESDIRKLGLESFFTVSELSPQIRERIQGKSFKDNDLITMDDLRYVRVLHKNAEGRILVGELICNKAISEEIMEILKVLYKKSYPIERMVLVDEYNASDEKSMEANNSSSFNFRLISGTQKLSKHGKGMAIDINPLYNPYVKKNKEGKLLVEPLSGRKYTDRSRNFRYKITRNDACCQEFLKRGYTWGGDWKSVKDYQHFEK